MAALPHVPPEVAQRASRVNVLLIDVDGVLTDGRIVYADYGDELKFFDVQDGAGLVFWNRAGLKSAVITARTSRIASSISPSPRSAPPGKRPLYWGRPMASQNCAQKWVWAEAALLRYFPSLQRRFPRLGMPRFRTCRSRR